MPQSPVPTEFDEAIPEPSERSNQQEDGDLTELMLEARRVYARYADEFVEQLSICPYAAKARKDGRVLVDVEPRLNPTNIQIADRIDAIAAQSEIEIGLIVCPQVHLDRLDFERFCAEVGEIHANRNPRGQQPFALAAFHPDAHMDPSTPARLTPFLRRTPDPTLQLVRRTALDRVRLGEGAHGTKFMDINKMTLADVEAAARNEPTPLHERIAQMNHDTVHELGGDTLRARLDAIRDDRNASYARLARDRRKRGEK